MNDAETITGQPTDGRRARRERSRLAVIDAVFSLVQDGKIPPTVDDVATRAGVSVSSVFRNFDGLDDLQRQALDQFQDRFAHLFTVPAEPDAPLAQRIAGLIERRLDLYDQAGPLMKLARQRALDYEPLAEALARNRGMLADQARGLFQPETRNRQPADAADLVATIDSFTSPEAHEVMTKSHARSRRQVARSWTIGVQAVLDGWPDRTPRSRKKTETMP